MKSRQKQTHQPGLFLTPPVALLLCCLCIPIWAGVPAQKSAVSFSPTIIDFGQVPSGTKCTQLLTVTFNRRVFSPDHLPALNPGWDSSAGVSLFSRFDGPKMIRVVYRVTVPTYEAGAFRDSLILIGDKTGPAVDLTTLTAENTGVIAVGQVVQGLGVNPARIDFGRISAGKGVTQALHVGFFRFNLVLAPDPNPKKPEKNVPPTSPDWWNMSVTSSSPDIIAHDPSEMGLNGSAWTTWQITLNPQTPVGVLTAELVFRTGNGYSVTVPVSAQVEGTSPLEPPTPSKH